MRGTIKNKEEIERLFNIGRRSSSPFTMVIALNNTPLMQGRCAFIAGKKLGAAPLRSRCKRVMREVVRELGGPWQGWDLVFVARGRIARADHELVVKRTKELLSELGVM